MKVPVARILFGRLNQTDAKVLLKQHKGQHHLLRDSNPAVRAFSDSATEVAAPSGLGGWDRDLSIEPFEGANPVPAKTLTYHFTGANSERKEAYFAKQTAHPYPLWDPIRSRPGTADFEDLIDDVAMVVQDVDGRFHARYVRREDMDKLPAELRAAITANSRGVWDVPTSTPGSQPSREVQRIMDALRTHHNVLLYGPPGTGKTHLVTEVRTHFGQGAAVTIDTEAEMGAVTETSPGTGMLHSEWATFHQSYSYEDFLIGLRPEPQGSGGFKLVPRPGILLELAEWARIPGHESLLIIDEINRGNVSRIFGEFITLIEPDKRLSPDGSETATTVAVRLPFVDVGTPVEVAMHDGTTESVTTPFTMPRAVYTLATMNSVDKSVAPLDAALRRRFHVVDVSPDTELFATRLNLGSANLTKADIPSKPSTLAESKTVALALLQVLNKRISLFLGPDFQFGEWFLAPLLSASSDAEGLAAIAEVWRTKLMPQLEEYFVGRADQFAKVLGDPTDEKALVIDSPETSYAELGAVQAVRANARATDDDLLALISRIARGGVAPAPAPGAAPTPDAEAGPDPVST